MQSGIYVEHKQPGRSGNCVLLPDNFDVSPVGWVEHRETQI
jgi:hypothetical protein